MFDAQRIINILKYVPQPPDEVLPEGCTVSALDAFETRTGVSLPQDMRQWLMLTNGPCVGPGGFYGVRTCRSFLDIEMHFHIFPEWKTKQWIPVAGDGCGNHYILPPENKFGRGHPVLFIDTSVSTNAPHFVVSSDLQHFIIAILEKELGALGWPFNQDLVTHFDPEVLQCYDVILPWAATQT